MIVAMVSPFFILKFSFLSWVFTVPSEIFSRYCKNFSEPEFFAAELHGLHEITYGRKIATLRRPESFLGTARAARYYLSEVHSEGLIQI